MDHHLRAAQLKICEAQSLLKFFDGVQLGEVTSKADLQRIKARLKAALAEIAGAFADVNGVGKI